MSSGADPALRPADGANPPGPTEASTPPIAPSSRPAAAGGAARTKPAARPKSSSRQLPQYTVVILNDRFHSFPYVIETLQKVFGYGWLRAMMLTVRIHTTGRAAVWTGSLEVAEFKRERILGRGPDVYASRRVEFPLGCEIQPLV